MTKVGRILQTTSKDFDFDTFEMLGTAKTIIGATRRQVIFQQFRMACKTSTNPECLRVLPPALEQKFKEQNLPENHELCTEHNPGGTMELVEDTHGLISTRACSGHNGPC